MYLVLNFVVDAKEWKKLTIETIIWRWKFLNDNE